MRQPESAERVSRGKFTLTRRAKADLVEIWRYVAEHNEPAADRLIDRLMALFRVLAEQPRISLPLGGRHKGIRYWPGDYVVFLREVNHGIEIIRVVHGSRERGGIDLEDLED